MSVKQGYLFEREIVASGLGLGMHIRKIPTSIFGDHKVQGTYDVFVVTGGVFFALELKEIAKADSFPLNRVEPHQVDDLVAAHNSGGRAFVLVNYRVGRNIKVYAIPIYDWIHLETVLGRKSIPHDKFSEFLELPNIKEELGTSLYRWDLRELFKFPYKKRANVKRDKPTSSNNNSGGRTRTPRNGRSRRRGGDVGGEATLDTPSLGNT